MQRTSASNSQTTGCGKKEACAVDYKSLKQLFPRNSLRETLNFLKAYHESIAELTAALKMKAGLEQLKLYDHDHKEIYESYLQN